MVTVAYLPLEEFFKHSKVIDYNSKALVAPELARRDIYTNGSALTDFLKRYKNKPHKSSIATFFK